MSPVRWKTSYELRVPHLDQQHKKLVELFNEAERLARLKGLDHGRVSLLLRELSHYTITHFVDEEGLMARSDYPGLAEHKALHAAFAERIRDRRRAFTAGEKLDLAGLSRELWAWLLDHIIREDKKVALHLIGSSRRDQV